MKEIVKAISRWIAIFVVSPLILMSKIGLYILKSDRIFVFCSQMVSLIPDYVGTYFRTAFYTFTLSNCSFTGHIRFGTFISKYQTKIGKNFYIGAYNIIGLADIGDNVVIANNTSIMSGRRQHNFSDPTADIMEVRGNFVPVRIGDSVFIGDRAVIMADIGEYSIIGAGSVVVKDIPPYSVAVGNPAKVVRQRPKAEL